MGEVTAKKSMSERQKKEKNEGGKGKVLKLQERSTTEDPRLQERKEHI